MYKITGDIETTSDGKFICVCWYNGNDAGHFTDAGKFLDFLIKNKVSQVYFHYGGGFDFQYILQEIRDNRTDLTITNFLNVGSLIYTFTVVNDNKFACSFDDTFPLFRCSLDKAGSALTGRTKLDIVDRSHLEDFPFDDIVKYCIEDCVLLWDCLHEFEQEIGMPLQLSAPMQALKHFQVNYMEKNWQLWRDIKPMNMRTIGTLLPWYYGGHTEVYTLYGENIYQYDIVNCYGYSMREYGAPIGYPIWVSKRYEGEDKVGFYSVNVFDNLHHPHTCFKHKEGYYNKLYFANTRTELFVSELDLRFFDNFGIKYKVNYGILFYHEPLFFAEYIDYWYEKRFQSKKLTFIAKLMINSLYGKFGQNPLRKNSAVIIPKDEKCDDWYDEKLRIGKSDKKVLAWYLQPQIAAWITSGARCLLHYYMYRFVENGGKLYYLDTDSIRTDKPFHMDAGFDFFTDEKSKELGKLELESVAKRGYYLGCKWYGEVMENDEFITHTKGFRNPNFTEEMFYKSLHENYEFESARKYFMKFKSALKTTGDFIHLTEQTKTVSEFTLKRKRHVNGIDTEPYFLTSNGKLI